MRKRQPARRTSCLFVLWCSKPVSRVLSFKTAIYLDAPLLTRSSRLLNTTGPVCVCSHGVAPDRVYSDGHFYAPSGELLPRLSTLTSTQERGSPAAHTHLKTGEAVYLCCTCPRVAPGGCYPLSLPCGARTFLTGGPFAPPARLSSLLPAYHTGNQGGCQMPGKIFFSGLSIILECVRIPY